VEKTAPISEVAISVPSTVNIKKIVEEAEQAKIEVKETKLKLQQANIIINKLIRSKRILMKRVKRLIYEKKIEYRKSKSDTNKF